MTQRNPFSSEYQHESGWLNGNVSPAKYIYKKEWDKLHHSDIAKVIIGKNVSVREMYNLGYTP